MANSKIQLSLEQIPALKEPMILMKLGDYVFLPEEMVKNFVGKIAPKATFKPLGKSGATGVYDGKRLVAYLNPKTGETRIFPLLENLKPGKEIAERAAAIAAKIANDPSLFPKDETEVIALTPSTLLGVNHTKTGKQHSLPSQYLSYVRFQRRVNNYPVYGPNTKAMIAVGADETIHGFSHSWRKATRADQMVKPDSREKIAESILAQLESFAKNNQVRVDKVRICYYDGGKNYLQPVFRFEATILAKLPKDKKKGAANSHIFGYVSIGTPVEELPELGKIQGESPAKLGTGNPKENSKSIVPPHGDPLVGRYVVRNDSTSWVDSANDFWSSLEFAQGFFGGPIPFTNSQYYWAEPRLYLNEKDSFINAVHIALTESHGNWGLFTTKDNHEDFVFLNDIPAGGYGGAEGVKLAYWIIHSCEVIPTATDETTSFNVWWNIFQGLHAVVGYRTEMWIADGVTGPFGLSIGLGAPVVSAWLNEVASNDSYGDGDTYYLDGNRDIEEPMGRASAVVVSGHSDDTAHDVGFLGAATDLTEWWFNN